jgi:2-polyprenyl-6-methoxyphenol hydroxylase-like FAD-dependent oxidoreductase
MTVLNGQTTISTSNAASADADSMCYAAVESEIFRPDVLIIGAGIAGCPLAVSLSAQGLNVLLVERAPGPRRIFKGEYLQPAAVKYLNEIGFASTFEAASSSAITHLRFRDIDSDGDIQSSITMHYPEGRPARSIEYFDMLVSFMSKAKIALGDNFWQGAELSADNLDSADFITKPEFTVSHPTRGKIRVRPRWVVGCDGRGSTVRRWMGGRVPEKNGRVVFGINDEFIFGTQIHENSDKAERYDVIRTQHRGTVSLFNLGNVGQRIYLSQPEPSKDQFAKMNQNFLGILKDIQPATGLKSLPEQISVSGYPANTSWFGPSNKGVFLLAGDALAVTTPYGGQGMTVAMEHVKFLNEHFDWKSESKSTHALAKSAYNNLTVKVHERVNFLNFGLYYTFFSRPTVFKHSTHQILKRWEKNPELKTRVARLFGGLDQDMPSLMEILDLEGLPFSRAASKLMHRNIRWG